MHGYYKSVRYIDCGQSSGTPHTASTPGPRSTLWADTISYTRVGRSTAPEMMLEVTTLEARTMYLLYDRDSSTEYLVNFAIADSN